MKKVVYLIILSLPLIIMAKMKSASSSGAPASHTGAPNEKTCATSGCHDDNKVNSGTAVLSIALDNNATQYIPGKTYAIKVKVADSGINRFGFQIVALHNNALTNAGKFEIINHERTQMVKNSESLLDREYVTYTFDGTDAISTGTGEWIVNWTAPSVNEGDITFYASAVSGNDDETDKGDYTFTKSFVVSAQ